MSNVKSNEQLRCENPNSLETMFRKYCEERSKIRDWHGLNLIEWKDGTNGSGRKNQYTQQDHNYARLAASDFELTFVRYYIRHCHNFNKRYCYDIEHKLYITLKTSLTPVSKRILDVVKHRGLETHEYFVMDVSDIKSHVNLGDNNVVIYLDVNENKYYIYFYPTLLESIASEIFLEWEGDFVKWKEKVLISKQNDIYFRDFESVIQAVEGCAEFFLEEKLRLFDEAFANKESRTMVVPAKSKIGKIKPYVIENNTIIPFGNTPRICHNKPLNTPIKKHPASQQRKDASPWGGEKT